MPSEKRLNQGACVIIECFEQIPCNPCSDACPKEAIKIEGNINNLPEVDYEKCTGCGLCISACPGLAIFVVHKNINSSDKNSNLSTQSKLINTNHKQGIVMLPYEFLPLPQKGDIVKGLSREGKIICEARVTRVLLTKKQDRTAVISILVPQKLIMEVRNIRIPV